MTPTPTPLDLNKNYSMIKVKELLDRYFLQLMDTTATLKEDGRYNVQGIWQYPAVYDDDNHILVSINNETAIVDHIKIEGKWVSKYHYLQTYERLQNCGPDTFGYYKRSTDEEIIKYIKSYMKKMKWIMRRDKILKIINKT